ncbi:nitronate monooxygenase [Neisseria sp. MVDL18-041461]|uniref:nitronate monooxygenase n=1 Tax=unclassified Neisseria TaxID=2623750 RepID=UPI0034652D3D
MAGVQSSNLAITACQAGALGSLPAAMLPSEKLCAEIETIRRHTDRPFNINFFAHRQPEADAAQQAKWLAALAPFYREFGLTEQDVLQGGRQPFGNEQAEIVMQYRPPVVSFHFGLPEQALLDKVKSSGAVVMSSATTVEEARWLEAYGADIIIAQGLEAGGHRGMFLSRDLNRQQGLFSLLPQIRAAVNMPVVAAGGISDATTARAARTLGAAGIQIGTALMLADEADTSALPPQSPAKRTGRRYRVNQSVQQRLCPRYREPLYPRSRPLQRCRTAFPARPIRFRTSKSGRRNARIR